MHDLAQPQLRSETLTDRYRPAVSQDEHLQVASQSFFFENGQEIGTLERDVGK